MAGPVGNASGAALAVTPWMGWNTWYSYGWSFDEARIRGIANHLVSDGFAAKGYKLVWLDAGWWHGSRRADGSIQISTIQWPHGMRWLVQYLHSRGLRAGIYTDAGRDGCLGANTGSYGHIQQDMNTFATWGFDAVKVDFCSGSQMGLDPAAIYAAYGRAIAGNSARRRMIFVICDPIPPHGSWRFGPDLAQGWRTGSDIAAGGTGSGAIVTWSGFRYSGFVGSVLGNLDDDAAHGRVAGPGHWSDPDYLQAGAPTLTAVEQQSQFSMWAMLAAPLIIGRDLTTFSPSTRSMLQNAEVIALDQDARGAQGAMTSDDHGLQVWCKPLAGRGASAVALLNRTAGSADITVSWKGVGLHGPVRVRDLWRHRNLGSYATRYRARVSPHATVLVKVQEIDAARRRSLCGSRT